MFCLCLSPEFFTWHLDLMLVTFPIIYVNLAAAAICICRCKIGLPLRQVKINTGEKVLVAIV